MSDHRIYFGEGSATVTTVPLRNGRALAVSSATYVVKDLRYNEDQDAHTLASGAATVDPVSTTITAAAGDGTGDPRQITVTSATGITAGHQYLLSHGGHTELVMVEGVSGTTVRLRHAVKHYFASGAALLGVEVSCSVSAEVTADENYLGANNLAVRWEFAGLPPPVVELLHLERHVVAPVVSRADMLSFDHTLGGYDGDNLSLDLAITQAVTDLRIDLLSCGHDDSSYLTGPIGKECVKHAAAYHALKSSTNESAVRKAEAYRQRYGELRSNLLTGLTKEKTAKLNDDGAKTGVDYHSLFLAQW